MQTTTSLWRRPFQSANALIPLSLVIALGIAFAAMRATAMLGGAAFRPLLPLSFVLMMAAPWILLTAHGRRQIGLTPATNIKHYLIGAVMGIVAAGFCFVVGVALFDVSADNWYVSIAQNYRHTLDTAGFSFLKLQLFFTLPAMLFSPIGEEIFFRGILQRALEQHLSPKLSTLLECAAFGLVHLCHHGLFASATGIQILPLSGAIWVALMFGVAYSFAKLRKRSASLYPAMISHMAFNVAMNTIIFGALWKYLA